jgi:hypothetical protein
MKPKEQFPRRFHNFFLKKNETMSIQRNEEKRLTDLDYSVETDFLGDSSPLDDVDLAVSQNEFL